jgi:hypothetical protein
MTELKAVEDQQVLATALEFEKNIEDGERLLLDNKRLEFEKNDALRQVSHQVAQFAFDVYFGEFQRLCGKYGLDPKIDTIDPKTGQIKRIPKEG